MSVFCGARGSQVHIDEAYRVGRYLGQKRVRVVFGGGGKGCMGALADGVLVEGGQAIGYMPQKLAKPELSHPRADIVTVLDMAARKAVFWRDCDSFLCLPGGIGTLDELFEAWCLTKLGYMSKKVAIVNVAGFYDGLMAQTRQMVMDKFMPPEREQLARVFEDGIQASQWLLEE